MTESRQIATQEQVRLTPAQQQKERLDKFLGALEARQDQLSTLLSDSGIDPKRFLAVARRALSLDPDLVLKDHGALLQAFINAATDGLMPDKRQGAIVVYAGKPAWVPMVQGLLDIAYRSGNFKSIEARVVYYGDDFDYELGDDPWIKHKPKSRPAGQAAPAIIAAYAVAKTVNGGTFREVFEADDIRKVNAVSKAVNGPGKNWPEEMARKGPVRRMWKYLPKDDRMNRIAERDNELYDLDAMEAPEENARTLRGGFGAKPAPQALAQGADQVMDTPMGDVGDEAQDGELVGDPIPPKEEPKERVRDATDEEVERANRAALKPGEALVAEDLSRSEQEPMEDAFTISIGVAQSWLNVKQALRSVLKTGWPTDVQWREAWRKFVITGDKVDFLTDPYLFRCWLESGPSADAIEGNLRIMEKDSAFMKLADDVKDRIRARAAEVRDA